MYYLIFRPSAGAGLYMLDNTNGRETKWRYSASLVLHSPLCDETDSVTIEERISSHSWFVYGPYTDRPTLEAHPELFI